MKKIIIFIFVLLGISSCTSYYKPLKSGSILYLDMPKDMIMHTSLYLMKPKSEVEGILLDRHKTTNHFIVCNQCHVILALFYVPNILQACEMWIEFDTKKNKTYLLTMDDYPNCFVNVSTRGKFDFQIIPSQLKSGKRRG